MEILNYLIQFILYSEITGWFLVLKIIFLGFSLIFLSFIIWALLKTEWLKRLFFWDLKEFLTYRPYLVKKLLKDWKKIEERLESGVESEAKLAIIEADKMLDEVLKNMGYAGESLGERLNKLPSDILPNLEEVLSAHKMRNDIIHDPTYRLNLEEAKKALSIYEKTLIELDAL